MMTDGIIFESGIEDKIPIDLLRLCQENGVEVGYLEDEDNPTGSIAKYSFADSKILIARFVKRRRARFFIAKILGHLGLL